MCATKGKPRPKEDQGKAGTGPQPGSKAAGTQQEYLITDRALEQDQTTGMNERDGQWLAREGWRILERGESELANWIRRTMHFKKAGLYPMPGYLFSKVIPTGWEHGTREAIKAMADEIPILDLEGAYKVLHWLVASAAADRERKTSEQAQADQIAFDLLRDALGDGWTF
jgi:hypothetical protein